MDTEKTVDQLAPAVAKAVGGAVEITAFAPASSAARAIERPQGPDFASEVAQMAGGG
jgi:hypothetical protein